MMPQGEHCVEMMMQLGRSVRETIVRSRGRAGGAMGLAGVAKVTSADAIYELDMEVEPVIERFCEEWSKEVPLVLIAEGIGEAGREGKVVFPRGTPEYKAEMRVIIDPIDGTRELMYDKRSAWFLAGVAPNKGEGTRLKDIFAAVQVELPVSKQRLMDVFWAERGKGAKAARDLLRGDRFERIGELAIRPSTADNIHHGFASVSNFFPGTKVLSAKLMEEIALACVGAADVSRAMVFDDQYLSNGGQIYELLMGHDRFVADLRPLFYQLQGLPEGLCVHPYDMAAVLIAQEAGIEVTDGLGGEFDGPLDTETGLCWAGFANKKLRERIEPVMKRVVEGWRGEALRQ